MKKLLTMVMALVLATSLLAGAALAEGKIGWICNGFDNEIFANMYDSFKTLGERDGIEVLGGEHRADSSTLVEQAENMIAAGVNVLIFQNFDTEGTLELVEQWENEGVRVISYDGVSEAASVSIEAENYDVGYKIGKMTADWINANLADQDKVEVYIHGHFYDFLMERARGIEDALAELAPTAVIADRQDVMGSEEPNTFENSLVAHPDIQVVCSVSETACINITEWWISELENAGVDLSKYAGFSVDGTQAGLDSIAASRTNESVYRGTLDAKLGVYMGPTAEKIWDTAKALMAGEQVDNWYFEFQEVTADNIAEYGY